ncbi:HrcA family transcriptional regulator [Candidatus Mycoplasma haematobovis]|uniref:Heat-inducible transcription repressor HrcA n=1 Tax=Candidatus Mycoplasma haematobovis TaxID=432608 RepID=A0A1A9QE98_9MOLU|nr:HrcA family transcriptional regulator [Candidatus Mycoplasma haematobovis]OAL10276.1 HrcA family transcriptional regulator [Candidatus Mycoplasma haematobovis]
MSKKDGNLNQRQKFILKTLIEKYIVEIDLISSLSLAKTKELKSWSSATIRNDMLVLEEKGYLKKEHYSSGKIPTKLGYEFYIEFLMKNFCSKNNFEIKDKLIEVFSNRHLSIDEMIDKCSFLISEFLNLPLILTRTKKIENEYLKKIDIVNIDRNSYLIFIVTSHGKIIKNTVEIKDLNSEEVSDVIASIRLLNEKLSNCKITEINTKLNSIVPNLKGKIHQFEFVYENIIFQMINNFLQKIKPVSKIYNTKSIIFQPEIKRNQIDIVDIFKLLENYSTFSPFNYNFLRTGNTLINLENEVEGLSIATTTIDINLTTHELSVVGPIRMNYALIKYLFEFINEKLNFLKKS